MSGRVDSTSHAAAIARVAEAGKYASELREHLEEITRSPAFKGSHRSQVFLKHIVERSLGGNSESLRERTIGMELFGRPADYDTGEDAIVRVTASDVRKRLLQFYGNANGGLRFRIEIPSGAYLPEFRCVSAKEPIAAVGDAVDCRTEGDSSAVAPPPLPVAAVEPPAEPKAYSENPAVALPDPPVFSRIQPHWGRYAFAGTILMLAGALAGWSVGRHAANRPWPANDLIAEAFPGPSHTVQVIVSDDGLVLTQVLLGRRFTLQEYENLSYLNAPEWGEGANLQRLRRVLSTQQITNVGDLQNAARIRENLRARDWEVTIRHARQVNARDFRNGNFILLGGTFSNPWGTLFLVQDSNFPLEDPAPGGTASAYLNRHPALGEPARFGVEVNQNGKTLTHARVSLLENVSHTGRVMLVAGQSVSATELAGEFLFHGESVAKVRGMLGLRGNSRLPDLEMILRVTEVNQVGDSVQLVACRELTGHSD